MMMDAMTLHEFQASWQPLLSQSCVKEETFNDEQKKQQQQQQEQEEQEEEETPTASTADPFDCSDLFLPPLRQQIDTAVSKAVEEWQDLDDRKVLADDTPPPVWYTRHVRLPVGFDYLGRRRSTDDDEEEEEEDDNSDTTSTSLQQNSNDKDDDRVLSLDDPTQTEAYTPHLHRLFRSIPTVQSLRAATTNFSHRTADTVRLRGNDCHAVAAAAAASSSVPLLPQTMSSSVATMQWECTWVRQKKTRHNNNTNNNNNTTINPDRAVVEIVGSSTLYDLHKILVQMAAGCCLPPTPDNNDKTICFFFIENVFYVNGTTATDYATRAIQQWLDTGNRWKQLGLDRNAVACRSMMTVATQDLKLRLGVRYLYYNQDLSPTPEIALHLTDRALRRRHSFPLPMIHDIWRRRRTEKLPYCSGCGGTDRVVDCVTSKLSAIQTVCALCRPCCDRFKVVAQEDTMLYEEWKRDKDILDSLTSAMEEEE